MSRKTEGWWGAPALPLWKCPECGEFSDPDTWEETEAGCEDCGTHDALRCPRCDEIFDHVWGSDRIADAQATAEEEQS